MESDSEPDVYDRCDGLARSWRVEIDRLVESPTSVVAYGRRGRESVVLKVTRRAGDEWRSGEILRAFDGRGAARVLEYTDGASLLERIDPGESLAAVALSGRDEDATAILADVIAAQSPGDPPAGCPTVRDWGKGFAQHRKREARKRRRGGPVIAPDLIAEGEAVYASLAASQRNPRLLHGDLQHYNVLLDRTRGWLAIDPKGVVGELEFELGAALRNPHGRPDLVGDAATIARRVRQLQSRLDIDAARALSWSFAQAVLSLVWCVEDGFPIESANPSLVFATAARAMRDATRA